jgi:hypothetical protein
MFTAVAYPQRCWPSNATSDGILSAGRGLANLPSTSLAPSTQMRLQGTPPTDNWAYPARKSQRQQKAPRPEGAAQIAFCRGLTRKMLRPQCCMASRVATPFLRCHHATLEGREEHPGEMPIAVIHEMARASENCRTEQAVSGRWLHCRESSTPHKRAKSSTATEDSVCTVRIATHVTKHLSSEYRRTTMQYDTTPSTLAEDRQGVPFPPNAAHSPSSEP